MLLCVCARKCAPPTLLGSGLRGCLNSPSFNAWNRDLIRGEPSNSSAAQLSPRTVARLHRHPLGLRAPLARETTSLSAASGPTSQGRSPASTPSPGRIGLSEQGQPLDAASVSFATIHAAFAQQMRAQPQELGVSRPPRVHLRYGPVTHSPSQRWLCQSASSDSFPPRMRLKLRGF